MKKIKNLIKQYYLYVLTIIAIVLPWFFNHGYLFFTDMSWGAQIKLNFYSGWFLTNVFLKSLSFLLPMDLIQKIFIAITLLTVLLGAKKIVDNFLSNKYSIFIVSLFAIFNPFIYDRMMYGQIGIVLAFAFLCFLVGYLLEYLNKEKNSQILVAGIFTAFSIQFSMHFIFFVGAFWLLFIIAFILKKRMISKKLLKGVALVIIFVFVLNFNWILGMSLGITPQAKSISSGIQKQDFIAFQTSGKTGLEALKNVVMMSGFWGKDQYRYIDLTKVKEGWGRSFVLLLPLILLGILSGLKIIKPKNSEELRIENRELSKNKADHSKGGIHNSKFLILYSRMLAVGLIILYVIAIILAVGIRLPVAREITYWMFEHIPFYKGMRETQKWVAVIVVIYLIFLSIGVKRLFQFKIIEKNKIIVSIFLSGVIIMQAPLMLWGLGGQVKPTEYPQDWYEVNEFIKLESYKVHKVENVCNDSILFLPWHMYMGFSWIGNVVSNPAYKFFSCPVIQGSNMEWGGIYNNSGDTKSEAIQNWIFTKGQMDLLSNNEIDIKYVILAKEVDWKDYLWIDKINELVLIRETETLIVYKVKSS